MSKKILLKKNQFYKVFFHEIRHILKLLTQNTNLELSKAHFKLPNFLFPYFYFLNKAWLGKSAD